MRSHFCLVLALVAAIVTIGAGSARDAAPAYFLITTQPNERGFVVAITDPATIAEARELIRAGKSKIVNGIIVTSPASYNPPWKFHYEPSSVRLADFTIDSCDATATYVEDHLQDAGKNFLPGNRWCPWHTRLIREVGATTTPTTNPRR